MFSGKTEGKKRALVEQVILEHYNQYYRLAYGYVHHAEDASDIVQNGAYKALKSCHTLKQPEYAATWVYRIMLNECFTYLRQPKHLSYEQVQEGSGAEPEGDGREDRYADVDLQRALDALPDRDKAIVILKYFEEKKLEEIAEIMDENLSTVKSRLYRCMKKLRDILSGKETQKPAYPASSEKKLGVKA